MSDLTLTIYADDDVTPYIEFGTASGHARDYLHMPTEYAESEIDLKEGKARIGRINVRVIDPEYDPGTGAIRVGVNQAQRFVTSILGDADGYSKLNGRRVKLALSDGTVVQDGICAGAKLSETFAGFELSLEDIRARGIEIGAFDEVNTSTVLPRGVLDGFGQLPNGDWLVDPTEPLVGTVHSSGNYVEFGSPYWNGSDRVDPVLAVTDAVREAFRVTQRPHPSGGQLLQWPDVRILWRLEGSAGAYTEADLNNVVTNNAYLSRPARFIGTQEEGVGIHALYVPGLPAAGTSVEVIVVYNGPASETFPAHYTGTWGEYARNLLRGDYSSRDPRIRYDEAALLAIDTPVLIRHTEPVDDLREHFEELCKARGIAPGLNAAGEVTPVTADIPDPPVTLPVLDDDNCQAVPGWEHPITGAVTVVEYEYPRFHRLDEVSDPLGERSAGDGLAAVTQPVRVEPIDSTLLDVMGEHVHEVDGWPFGAIGGTDGSPVTGDVSDENGWSQAYRTGHALIDRLMYGGQSSFVRAMRSDTDVAALTVGDWVLDQRSWAPNYAEGERGRNHLAQVVAIKDLNPAWREIRLLDAAPYANPLTTPTLGTVTASDDGIVTVPVSTIPASAEVTVYYAVAASEPASDSGAWTYAGRTDTVGDVDTPPLPVGSTVWVRARSEKEGRRPSLWTTAQSVVIAQTPRVRRVRAYANDEDRTGWAYWTPNAYAAGVRISYEVHAIGDTATLADSVDVDASVGEYELPVEIRPGEQLTIEVEPWTGWTGSTVSGTAGTAIGATDVLEADESSYGMQAELKEVTSSGLTYEISGGALMSEAWIYTQTVAVGAVAADFPEPGAEVPDIGPAALPYTLEVAYPALGYVTLIRVYGMTADLEAGEFVQLEIPHLPPEVPVWEVLTDDTQEIDGVPVGIFLLRGQTRGIDISSVTVQTQVGSEPPSAERTPYRSEGDTSLITGEVLTANEWEHDIILDAGRLSYPFAWATLETGETQDIAVPPFDANRAPRIVSLDIVDQKIKAVGNDNTKGWWIQPTADEGTFNNDEIVFGSSLNHEVTIGATDTVSYMIGALDFPARSVPPGYVPDVREYRIIRGSSVTASTEPRITSIGLTEPTNGGSSMTIDIDADNLPASTTGWSLVAKARVNYGSGYGDRTDISADLSPALSTPTGTTHSSSHTWSTTPTRADSGSLYVFWEILVSLYDNTGAIVDSLAETVGWTYGTSSGREVQEVAS